MSLTPDWLPNLHPIVVHFPIALLPVAALVDLLGLFSPQRSVVRNTATWLYLAGTAFALLAYITGRSGVDAMTLTPVVEPLVNTHETWAFRTTWFFAFFASLRLAVSYVFRPRPVILLVAFILAWGGLVMLVQTARHGAVLVYQHGLGVRTLPTPDR
jgi:uncharacterized membrane protein